MNSLVPPTQVKCDLEDTDSFAALLSDLSKDPVLSALPSKKTTFVDCAGVDAFVDSILQADPEGPNTQAPLSQQLAADQKACDLINDNQFTDPDFTPQSVCCY